MPPSSRALDADFVDARTVGDAVVAKACALTRVDADAFARSRASKIDASDNAIESISNVKSSFLTWMSFANNALKGDALRELGDGCARTRTLNVSNNRSLRTVRGIEGMNALAALIASECAIEDISSVKGLKELNTLALASNALEDVGDALSASPSLRKLTLSRNRLTKMTLNALEMSTNLRELRIGHNAFKAIPACAKTLTRLKILDVGHNAIDNWGSIGDLRTLVSLEQLTLRGNPIASERGYEEKILAICPGLKFLDGREVGRAAAARRREDVNGDDDKAKNRNARDAESGEIGDDDDYDDDARVAVEAKEDASNKVRKSKKENKAPRRREGEADDGERSFVQAFLSQNKGKVLDPEVAKEVAEKAKEDSKRTGVVGVFENKDLKRKGPSGSAAFKALASRVAEIGSWDDDEPVKKKPNASVEVAKKKDLKEMTPHERKAHLKLSRKRGY